MSSPSSAAHLQFVALPRPGQNWQRWLSGGISAALLFAIIVQLEHVGIARLWATIPASPLFWLAFAAYYLALPASEWIIFHRLWRLPGAGFAALLRKLVSNEVLMGYSGELSFYAWARRRSRLTAAPFAAIKDVSITSALTGNLMTLAMMVVAWPLLGALDVGIAPRHLWLSIAVIIAVSTVVAIFNRRILSLPARDLRFIFAVHILRLIATTILSGVLWHSALPDVPLSLWVLLAALQLLVTRLPLIPNKDLMFAAVALFVVGHDAQVAELIAFIASLILVTHLMIGGVLAIAELFDSAEHE